MKKCNPLTSILVLFASLLTSVATDVRAQVMPDSLFFTNSHPVIFPVNSTVISPQDSAWINDELLPMLQSLGPDGVIVGRASASPEGSWAKNVRLAEGRRDAAIRYLSTHGFDASRILFECVPEDYRLLRQMMQALRDPDYDRVNALMELHQDQYADLKRDLQRLDAGRLWKRIYRDYFPLLRAVRILATDRVARVFFDQPQVLSPHAFGRYGFDVVQPEGQVVLPSFTPAPTVSSTYRRELLSLRTNLLEWGAYVPQYGWCPMPNVALEYYPRHGHLTYGASFDCPWWIGNTTNHKYFELRNYQLETRYYLRDSDKSYADAAHTIPAEGKAAFQRLYLQAYAHACLYQIGFSAKKGWIGEGLGAGLGVGYVLPLGRSQHWRLDFGLQLGYFRTQYDPFVWGKPVYHGGEIDGNYYYNTDLYRPDFVKRMHRYTWFGPTRVGATLSYDLFYRRRDHKTPSLKSREKGAHRP